jgi:hypothetical protein
MKPTTRLNQVMIYPFAASPAGSTGGVKFVVATKQLFSNHYFSATLELRTIVDDAERTGQGFYLFYTTKSRVSGLTVKARNAIMKFKRRDRDLWALLSRRGTVAGRG